MTRVTMASTVRHHAAKPVEIARSLCGKPHSCQAYRFILWGCVCQKRCGLKRLNFSEAFDLDHSQLCVIWMVQLLQLLIQFIQWVDDFVLHPPVSSPWWLKTFSAQKNTLTQAIIQAPPWEILGFFSIHRPQHTFEKIQAQSLYGNSDLIENLWTSCAVYVIT